MSVVATCDKELNKCSVEPLPTIGHRCMLTPTALEGRAGVRKHTGLHVPQHACNADIPTASCKVTRIDVCVGRGSVCNGKGCEDEGGGVM